MQASAFIGYVLAAALIRWGLQYLTPRADLLIGTGLVLGLLGYILHRRSRAYAVLDLWLRASDEDRERLKPTLWQALGLKPALAMPTDHEAGHIFDYPPASRGLAWVMFWITTVFAAGPLLALIRARSEPGDGWGLFGLGALFVWAATAWGRQLKWAGVRLHVTDDSLEEALGSKVRRIRWSSLKSVRRSRLHRLTFTGQDGTAIEVFPHLRNFAQFDDLVARRLKFGSGGAA
jgi:hypothetical protein